MDKKSIYNSEFIFDNKHESKLCIRHKISDKSLIFLSKKIRKECRKLFDLFGALPKSVSITLVYSRKEMDLYWGSKTPSWFSGFMRKGESYVFSPDIYKNNNKKLESIYKTIIHELVHLFIHDMNDNPLLWVDEGVALFLAGQKRSKKIKNKDICFLMDNNFLTDNMGIPEFVNNGGYDVSYFLVSQMHKKSKFTDLLKIARIDANRKDKKKVKTTVKKLLGDGYGLAKFLK